MMYISTYQGQMLEEEEKLQLRPIDLVLFLADLAECCQVRQSQH